MAAPLTGKRFRGLTLAAVVNHPLAIVRLLCRLAVPLGRRRLPVVGVVGQVEAYGVLPPEQGRGKRSAATAEFG